MAETKITQLVISPSIDGTEYLIVDNTEVTRRTTINSLSSVVQTWAIPSNTIVQSNSATWNNTSSTVQSNSATWSQGNSAVNTVVQSNSATWNNTSSTVQSNSATWSQGNSAVNTVVQSNSATWSQGIVYLNVVSISGNYLISTNDLGRMLVYSATSPITAYITSSLNISGFNTTVAQLSTGTITIALSSNYSANLISYSNLVQTAGTGAIATIARVLNNTFLITGLLQ